MSNQRTTFLKRQREQNRKDKLAAKQARLAARRAVPKEQRDSSPSLEFDAEGRPIIVTDGEGPTDAPHDGPQQPQQTQQTDQKPGTGTGTGTG